MLQREEQHKLKNKVAHRIQYAPLFCMDVRKFKNQAKMIECKEMNQSGIKE